MPNAVVIANADDADPGLVGAHLEERGFTLTTVTREDPDPWLPPTSADLVVILGSAWSVYWESMQEPVARECTFVATAVEAGVPVLGICFGAQLLARALGGEVVPAARQELGWLEIEPVAAAALEPLIEAGPWFQWHADTFTLPPGAELLARSAVGPQAFRLGGALAVQFHPEVTPDIVARWAASDPAPLAEVGLDAATVVERTAQEQQRVRPATARLVDGFLYGEAS